MIRKYERGVVLSMSTMIEMSSLFDTVAKNIFHPSQKLPTFGGMSEFPGLYSVQLYSALQYRCTFVQCRMCSLSHYIPDCFLGFSTVSN